MEDYSYTKFICFYNSATKHFLRWNRNNTQRTNTSLSHYFPVHLGAVHMVRRYVGTMWVCTVCTPSQTRGSVLLAHRRVPAVKHTLADGYSFPRPLNASALAGQYIKKRHI